MTGLTKGPKTTYECSICLKPYIKKGCLTKHLKNVHQVTAPPAGKEFLDSTSYSELDRDETILRTVGQIITGHDFMQDIFGDEGDDLEGEVDDTVEVVNQEVEPARHEHEETVTPSTLSPPVTAPTVPPCAEAQKYIIQKGKTLPASFLASVLPAPGFLEELDKSLKDQEEPPEVTHMLTTVDDDISCHICEICGENYIGKAKLSEHILEHDKGAPSPPADMPSLGDYLASMKYSMDRQTAIMSQQSATMSQHLKIISRQGVMIEKLLAFQHIKTRENTTTIETVTLEEPSLLLKCTDCDFEGDSNNKLDSHMRAKHIMQPEPVKCPMCNFTDNSGSELVKHVENKHPEKYECELCRQHFTSITELNKHITENHVQQNQKSTETGLLIGDSHIKSVSNRILERACKGQRLRNPARTKPSEGSAYTTTRYWPNAKFPDSNLEERLPKLLREKPYEYMITLTPSNNISNVKEMENQMQYKHAESTALETLALVEKAFKDSDTLKDAMIVELPPRVDSERLQSLTEYSNFVLRDAVNKSTLKQRITIASLDGLWDYSEQDIYGHPDSSRYDGIHMRGKHGSKAYTRCIEEAVKSSRFSNTSITPSATFPTTYPSIPTSNRYQVLSN